MLLLILKVRGIHVQIQMKNIYPNELKTEIKLTDTEEMTRTIGINLKRARLERGFSLDDVSARSTVSKSMLSDIERGRKCPTVAVLHKICDGIRVSLPSLLKVPDKFIEVVKNQERSNHKDVDLQEIFKYDINTSLEIFRTRIAPHTEIPEKPHGEKVWKYIMVIEGTFTLILDNETYEIGKGEAVRFLANKKHTYANKTDDDLLMFNITYYEG